MSLIKEGLDKIRCGIGWHRYCSIPDEAHFLDSNRTGRPHAVIYHHKCLRCGYKSIGFHTMLRGEMEPENELIFCEDKWIAGVLKNNEK